MKARYKGGPTGGTIKCPRCGSGNTYEEILPDSKGAFLSRLLCLEKECQHTWSDKIGPYPSERRQRDGE
jgi:transposase-like protein